MGDARRSVVVLIPRFGLFAAIRSRKHNGAIELPGGKVEPGEAPYEAARREVNEEVGPLLAYCQPLRPLGDFAHITYGAAWICTAYAGAYSGAHPRDGTEGEALWATRDELLAGTYGEVVRRILAAYDAEVWRDG